MRSGLDAQRPVNRLRPPPFQRSWTRRVIRFRNGTANGLLLDSPRLSGNNGSEFRQCRPLYSGPQAPRDGDRVFLAAPNGHPDQPDGSFTVAGVRMNGAGLNSGSSPLSLAFLDGYELVDS